MYLVIILVYQNSVGVSTPQLQLTVEFLESLIWIMQDIFIRSLSLTRNCMQSEGELRFCISLYEIFINLDFKKLDITIFVIQSRNTIHKRIDGMKSEDYHKIKPDYNNLRFHMEILFNKMRNNSLISMHLIQTTLEGIQK